MVDKFHNPWEITRFTVITRKIKSNKIEKVREKLHDLINLSPIPQVSRAPKRKTETLNTEDPGVFYLFLASKHHWATFIGMNRAPLI